MRKIFAMLFVLILALFACDKDKDDKKDPSVETATLKVWALTDEIQTMIDGYYQGAHSGVEAQSTLYSNDDMSAKLDAALEVGEGMPDVLSLEAAYVRKYIESGCLLDLSDIAGGLKDSHYAYSYDVGAYNGKVYAISWQATPGAVYYRRSLAKKYLGTDDPAAVQSYLSTTAKFLETAALLKSKSAGKCKIVATSGAFFYPYKSNRTNPWVVDRKLVVDDQMVAYLDMAKTLWDNGYEAGTGQWTDDWYAGMNGSLTDSSGAGVEVFCYFLPTWGLHFLLKKHAPDTSGDWAVTQGPLSYYWGGTWMAAYKDTKHPDEAKEFIRYLTCDEDFLESWAKDTGDFVSDRNVVDKISSTYSEPFLGGQNHYALFAEMAGSVSGTLVQATDFDIDALFSDSAADYVYDGKNKQTALTEFKSNVEAGVGIPSAAK